jgi:dihydroorotate dehydrogenase (fumarate)
MADLATTYLGIPIVSPIVASAGPDTGKVDTLVQLQDAGVGAVVLPSLFEEEIVAEELSLLKALEQGTNSFAESIDYFPETDYYDLGPDRHVRLVEEAKRKLSVPVVASVNAAHSGSWQRYAGLMADAGADAIELNLYAMPSDPARSAADVEAAYLDVVREVRAAVRVPLAVKLSPYFSSLSHFAAALVAAGVDGLVLFNRFYSPDLNLDTLTVEPRLELSRPSELRLPLRWLAVLRPQLPTVSLAATSGVGSYEDVAKALLVGADVACMTSAILREGPSHVAAVLAGLRTWLEENEYESVDQMRGSVSAATSGDPEAFERANYVKVLSSYAPSPHL